MSYGDPESYGRAMAAMTIVFGPLPPPRHGMSSVNEAMVALLEDHGIDVLKLDTAPRSLDRNLSVRLKRIGRVASALGRLFAAARRGRVAYFSLSGGLGLLYEATGVLLARVRGAQIVVHHHAFSYLDEPFWPMKLLTWAGGASALHVTLGERMVDALKERYPAARKALVVSNAGLIFRAAPTTSAEEATRIPRVVGFLSNLSTAKGVDDFVGLAEASQSRKLPWRFVMAGPFEDPREYSRLAPRMQALTNFEYRGPLYQKAKDDFFEEIDVFVFPTRYRNEAEPLVVLEAMRHGNPVIAFGRGCIPEMLGTQGGTVIPPGTEFVECALSELEAWRREGRLDSRAEGARRQVQARLEQGKEALAQLRAIIAGNES